MLKGIHDTTVAVGRAREDMEKMTQMLNAISDHPVKLPEIIATTNGSKISPLKKWGGGYLSINYITWKTRCTD